MHLSFTTFIKLGSNKNLSKFEMSSVLESISASNIKYLEWKDYLFLAINKSKQNKIFNELESTGSIIKAGNFVVEYPNTEKFSFPQLSGILEEKILKLSKRNKRIKFIINIMTYSRKRRHKISSYIKKKIKAIIKRYNVSIKILPTNRDSVELSPYKYHKENLSKRGIELICFDLKDQIRFAFTSWVTNPLKDIKQDEERPARLFTHGTSIKLSRTLVNLAKLKENDTLLDPFCGTGTILLEALRRKLNAIGVDKDPKCIRVSKENLNHFTMQFPSKLQLKEKWKVYNNDSRFINNIISDEINGIVTEPYLGPFLKELPPKEKGEKIILELENLYSKILREASKILKKDSYVIFIFPEYNYSKDLKLAPRYVEIGKRADLSVIERSKYFNVSLPIHIGRSHNIINRKLIIFQKK